MFKSETEFVDWLRKITPRQSAGLALGIGDDAALMRIRRGNQAILTTDLSIEGVHFLRKLHPPRAVGHRALARALSDVAAMGGTPRFALISIALSPETSRSWIEGFYEGVNALASRVGVVVVGGDTARVQSKTFADVVVVGEVPRGRALLRSGARPGDGIYVSGWLGLSALGLPKLKSGSGAGKGTGPAVRAHLFPEPRLELGRFLQENRLASAMMDLSDGLSADLPRLCAASGIGAVLDSAQIPTPTMPGLSTAAALKLALNGGEDYELLFTVRPEKARKIPARFKGIPLRQIGRIHSSRKIEIIFPGARRVPLAGGGYDHFRKK